jgi:hypothetical protein
MARKTLGLSWLAEADKVGSSALLKSVFEATVTSVATANLLHQRLTAKQITALEMHAANLLRAYLNVGKHGCGTRAL